MTATETTKPKVEKVGVLLDGIGEQCQFEHLEGEAREYCNGTGNQQPQLMG